MPSVALCALLLTVALGCESTTTQPHEETLQPSDPSNRHRVQVTVEGFDCCTGVVRLAVFRDSRDWLKEEHIYRARFVLPETSTEQLTLYGLPRGQYAIAAYQDTNNNGKLDRWFWLVPREPVGFSVVDAPRLPPNFSDSSFAVPGVRSVIVKLRN